jgi:DNA-binding transcriptional regulator LsrR (DeoR family)
VLADLIKPKDVIALAGGRTIHSLVKNLPTPADRLLSVVQSMGSVDSNLSAFDSQEIGRMLTLRLGGTFVAMNTPAFLPDKKMRDSLLKLEQVRVVHEYLDRANLAIVGVGTLENSVFVERNILSDDDKDELRAAGAVGEICGRFFNASGKECNTSWRERVMSVELEQLRRIPQVLGVISGNDRTAAIRAAIKGGLLKGLLVDESCARALLADVTEKKTSTSKKTKK